MKTRIPFNVIVLMVLLGVLISLSIYNIVWLFYGVPFGVIYYVHFCRYCGVIEITKEVLSVRYIAPWQKNISIDLSDIRKVDHEKGFYDLFSERSIGGIYVFPRYCYDRINIEIGNSDQYMIKINTRVYDFDKIVEIATHLEKHIR